MCEGIVSWDALKGKAVVTQSRSTVDHPMECGPPGSSVHRILQARTLEWVATPSPGDLPNPGMEPVSPVS